MKNRVLFIFRTNLSNREYYHDFKDLDTFKKNCHDFYLLQGIHYLENNEFDEVYIFRLSKKENSIVFDINGKKFNQIFTRNFSSCLRLPRPNISFFRGGFPDYCSLTRGNPKFFGLKLYLGAGKRVYPKYGGIYDLILVEDERDINPRYKCIPFFKTANPNIFYDIANKEKIYDLCWICNFEQITQKGQEYFLSTISRSSYLKSLKILHIGNKTRDIGKLCHKYSISNIDFSGQKNRSELNDFMNSSKFGIVTSNLNDGCPRIITELLCSGTPILIRRDTRLLDYFRIHCGLTFKDQELEHSVKNYLPKYDIIKKDLDGNKERLTIKNICDMNLDLWKKFQKN